jgi:hypothetical protein
MILFCISDNTKLSGFLHAVRHNALYAGYVYLSVRKSVSPSNLSDTPFSVAFKKLRRATISFVMYVRPSVRPCTWNDSAPTGRIFVKFHICRFFLENMSRNITFHSTLNIITGTLCEDRCKFFNHISPSSSKNEECFKQHLLRKSIHMFNNFSPKIVSCIRKCGKIL